MLRDTGGDNYYTTTNSCDLLSELQVMSVGQQLCVNYNKMTDIDAVQRSQTNTKDATTTKDQSSIGEDTTSLKGIDITTTIPDNDNSADVEGKRMEFESEDFEHAKTIDIRTVIQMMKNLKTDLNQDFRKQMQEWANQPTKPDSELKIAKLTAKIEVCEAKERMMVGVMANMNEKINELANKIESQEINQGKKSVILSGFEADSRKIYARRQLCEFMYDKLEIDVVIEDFYFIGSSTPKDIVMIFLSCNHKRLLFQNVKKIAHLRNSHGRKYSFRDHLTSKQVEFRKRSQYVANVVGEREAVDQKEVIVEKGDIYVGQEKYDYNIVPRIRQMCYKCRCRKSTRLCAYLQIGPEQ